jgi:phage tail sheath protein FI
MRDSLYNACNINPIHDSVQYGIAVWGQKTRVALAFNSSLDRLNVSRMVAYIRRGVRKLAYNYLMQPNDEITRKGLSSVVTSFLYGIQMGRGLYEFAVLCDSSNNTADMIDRNELEVQIALKPTKTVEFIYIPITLVRTGDAISS